MSVFHVFQIAHMVLNRSMHYILRIVNNQMTNSSWKFFYDRSSHRRCSVGKGVLRNFGKFIGKHLRQSLFFNKFAGLRPATLLKKKLWHRCFPVNFAIFLRAPISKEHLWWLLLL